MVPLLFVYMDTLNIIWTSIQQMWKTFLSGGGTITSSTVKVCSEPNAVITNQPLIGLDPSHPLTPVCIRDGGGVWGVWGM